MLHRAKHAVAAVGMLVIFAVSGCTTLDQFSGRSISYNLEAEQADDQELLLNIVRASLRRPMQFTGLDQIIGENQLSGTGGLTMPFGHRPRPNPDSLQLSGSALGQSQFYVTVYDKAEFYRGILTPLPLELFDYYLQQGFPRELLYDLFFDKLVINIQDGPEFTFEDSALNDFQRKQFNTVLEYLLSAGLTTEPTGIRTVKSAANPVLSGKSPAANAGAGQKTAAKGGGDTDLIPDREAGARLCFTYHDAKQAALLGNPNKAAFCGTELENSGSSQNGVPQFSLLLPKEIYDALDALQSSFKPAPNQADQIDTRTFRNKSVSLRFFLRSTQGILYYLGEVVRRDLHPEVYGAASGGGTQQRVLQIKTIIPYGTPPGGDCPEQGAMASSAAGAGNDGAPTAASVCENIFRLDTQPGEAAFLSIDYDGVNYSLSRDPRVYGRSYEVLELVKQLLALNASAKDFPSTIAIPVVGQ